MKLLGVLKLCEMQAFCYFLNKVMWDLLENAAFCSLWPLQLHFHTERGDAIVILWSEWVQSLRPEIHLCRAYKYM